MITKKKLCDGCGELRNIFKNVTEHGERKRFCAFCWKRYQAFQPKPKKSNKSLASRSPARSKEEAQYNKEIKPFKEDNPHCHAAIPGTCTHKTQDVHHKGGRENDLLLYVPWWLPVCRKCHDWIHDNPEAARDLKLLI